MTEAEQGLLFVEFLGAANGVFANYMTLVFAMLTASWFLAARSIEGARRSSSRRAWASKTTISPVTSR